MILASFASCANEEVNTSDNSIGDEINVYMGEPIYNFDPAEAYKNQTALKIVPLIFDNLFVLDEDGDVKKSLVEDYEIDEDKNIMIIELKEDAYWSDGKLLTANDVMYTWQRILDPSSSFEAASLLYDVKNAKAVKNAQKTSTGSAITLDDLGISTNGQKLEISFENDKVDYDSFLLKLTSVALSPVREDIVGRTEVANDWAKSSATMVSSGPFRLRSLAYEENITNPEAPIYQQILLERNTYYFRDYYEDPINKSVLPSKIIIKLRKSGESMVTDFTNKNLVFLADIPYIDRSAATLDKWKEITTITDSLSTNMLVLNQKATINGIELFARDNVRKALSLAINRQDIANKIIFAEPANGIVPNGVFNETSMKETFRDNATNNLDIKQNINEAKKLLSFEKDIEPSEFSFSISVPAQDDIHIEIAKLIANEWCKLGFKVSVKAVAAVENEDKALLTNAPIAGTKDDVFAENLMNREYQVALYDYVALSVDPLSTLAPFAFGYAGTATNSLNSPVFTVKPHISGYYNSEFNALIASAFKEADSEKRAQILHKAEGMLLESLPVIPVVFNQNIVMQDASLEDVVFDFYGSADFKSSSLKTKTEK